MSWSEFGIAGGTHRFHTTRWSVIARAGVDDPEGQRALSELCEQYWLPVYAFARRQGATPADALDQAQGFFLDLLSRDVVARAESGRGRFRTFLLTCFSNYLAGERERSGAQKRGGGRAVISLDVAQAEARIEPVAHSMHCAERVFERQWALTILAAVLERVRQEYVKRGRDQVFEALSVYLDDPTPALSYREAAADLGISEGAVKVTVHRLRQRFRELLLEEVTQTVDADTSAVDEIGDLLDALRS